MEPMFADELTHYGILGMKWGVRNGPPYPLDSKAHSASEKKAGWRKSLRKNSDHKLSKSFGSNSDKLKNVLSKRGVKIALGVAIGAAGTYAAVKLGKRHLVGGMAKKELLTALKSVNSAVDDMYKDPESKQALEWMYDSRKEAVSGIKQQIKDVFRSMHNNYRELPKKYSSLNEIPKNTKNLGDQFMKNDSPSAWRSLVRGVNGPIKSKASYLEDAIWENRAQNCSFCTASIAMRMKGFNVSAAASELPNFDYNFRKWFNGAVSKNVKSGTNSRQLYNLLLNQGEGHYGNLSVKLKDTGSGHSVFYVIKHGAVEILDGQRNLSYGRGFDQLSKKLFKDLIVDSSSYYDLTFAEPTKHILRAII